ncbi:MAG: ATP-binding protein [Myxococcaceae bacterium]
MLTGGEEGVAGPAKLADFIHSQRTRILDVWEGRVRSMRRADQLDSAKLRDHLPQVLEHVSHELGRERSEEDAEAEESPELHALFRLEEGFDERHLVIEYSVLRDVILELFSEVSGGVVRLDEALQLHRVIDDAILVSLARHTQARQRALIALDRISQAALETDDVDAFMPSLIRVLLETNPAIDAVTVLLLEDGDVLRVRASVGLDEELTRNFKLKVGEGFAGTIAAKREPLELRGARIGEVAISQFLRERGLRVIYGVPLVAGTQLLGVAHMGSLTTYEFADEDKLLFRTMCERASALLHRHTLRELAATEQQRADAFRERFVGIVSHDLRNPLNAITLSANRLLMEEGLTEPVLRASRRIVSAANRMSRMISELLDFTRGRLGGGIPVTRQSTNLRHMARHVIEELGIAYPDRQLQLLADGDFTGEWDPDRLAQLLGNLIKNALDYSPAGSPVKVMLSCGDGSFPERNGRCSDGGQTRVRMSVQNQGTPIPQQLLSTLFDPFRRASHSDSQGLGLGLYIVREIARAHGGDVSVTSDAATGTTFTVDLPRTAADSLPDKP